ncbi:hypothetical protein [Singulisphaera sp. GP187]|uniref:hypothetical protein n=1 Tax=Singulisphaera sp. GP187 TaxID=1882752 RepID=UPI001160F48C|nr:hypothetical protein [Singulisphaera sp. GP187]
MNEEAIVTTHGHPFWKCGTGWTRAGDLEPRDQVLTVNGPATVQSIEEQDGGSVWNLRLTDGSSYFAGRLGALVHDASPVAAP